MDGQRQRNALTAAEQALRALAEGDVERATRAAARAVELDQIGLYAGFPDVVAVAVADLATSGVAAPETVERLRVEVGLGPLQGLVDEIAG